MYGTYTSATLIFEVSQDQLTWLGKRGTRNTQGQDNIAGISLSANAVVATTIDVSGWLYFRARCSAFGAAGALSLAVSIYTPNNPPSFAASVGGTGAVGAVGAGNPVMIGGIDGNSLARYFSLDATGQLNVNQGTPGASAWPVSLASQPNPVGAPIESAGQLQRIADLLEQLVIENKVHSALLASLSSPTTDDVDSLRGDATLSLQ